MSNEIDKKLTAVCGLFCPACSIYIGTHEDPKRLEALSQRTQRPVEELHCQGCRAEQRCYYCEGLCKMFKCAADKGIDFCGACSEYPCQDLKTFQGEMPHRIELWEAQERIREVGYEKWSAEMNDHYSCPKCGAINSAYDLKCRRCGEMPSCGYVSRHKKEIEEFLANR